MLIRFNAFWLASEELLDKKIIAVLPEEKKKTNNNTQLILCSKFEATGSFSKNSKHISIWNNRSNSDVNSPQRNQFLNIMADSAFPNWIQNEQSYSN